MSFKAELSGADFAATVARMGSIAPANAKIPIVGHALIRADKKAITLAATNLDQALAMQVKGDGEGAVTASAHRLSVIAARLDPDRPVKLSATEAQLTITQGRSTFRLPVLPADDFPETLTEPLKNGTPWAVPADQLAPHIAALEGCIDVKDPRYYLAGVFIDFSEGGPHLVATDGNGLGAIRVPGLEPPEVKGLTGDGIILPAQCFAQLEGLAKGGGTLDLSISASAVTIEAGGARLRTKLVEGTYPDWRRVVPAADTRHVRVTVEAEAFRAAMARVGIVEGDLMQGGAKGGAKRKAPSIKLEVGENEIVASSRNTAGEEAIDACPCERLDGGDVQVGIATRLLGWASQSLAPADTLELGFGDTGGPVTLHRASDSDRHDLRIVMPLRI